MTKLTMEEAAEATGKSRSTIWRATKNGTLSFEKNEQDVIVIDAAELARVYPILKAWLSKQDGGEASEDETVAQHVAPATGETPRNVIRNNELATELKLLREKLSMVGQMHDQERTLLNTRIEELRQDRQDLRTERDRLLTTLQEQAMSVRLLTDQRVSRPPDPPEAPQPPEPASVPQRAASSGSRGGLFGWLRRS